MRYTNDKIKKLLDERNALIENYNIEIQKEIDKEKAKYKFSWLRFSLMVAAFIFIFLSIEINKRIFPKTSIFSWEYYGVK